MHDVALCSPSRASILGGLYAHTHGVVNNFTDYPQELPTFPRQLQSEGYTGLYRQVAHGRRR
ncbi:MAG: sulfatase-like hydrolase/transferase [Pirellulaceae bacterium]